VAEQQHWSFVVEARRRRRMMMSKDNITQFGGKVA